MVEEPTSGLKRSLPCTALVYMEGGGTNYMNVTHQLRKGAIAAKAADASTLKRGYGPATAALESAGIELSFLRISDIESADVLFFLPPESIAPLDLSRSLEFDFDMKSSSPASSSTKAIYQSTFARVKGISRGTAVTRVANSA